MALDELSGFQQISETRFNKPADQENIDLFDLIF